MTNNEELALKSRETFEHWWQVYYHNGNPPRLGWQAWREGDGYKTDEDDSELNDLWNSWQAAQSSLLAERDADKKRIAELEALTAEQDKRLIAYAAIATKNASEARTVSVKIKPPTIGRAYSALAHVWTVQEVREAFTAAGIKLEVGE